MKQIQTWLVVMSLFVCAPVFADNVEAPNDQFLDIVSNYQNSNPKPHLPEEARKFKVQAEFAVQEGNFDKALAFYGKALEIAPWWPEGYFNRAVILGGTKKYLEAMHEMKRYLLLVPDAPDARLAQDKIYQWEAGPEMAIVQPDPPYQGPVIQRFVCPSYNEETFTFDFSKHEVNEQCSGCWCLGDAKCNAGETYKFTAHGSKLSWEINGRSVAFDSATRTIVGFFQGGGYQCR